MFGRLTHSSAPAEETTYTWDALGHLSQIGSADATASYAYGISGMRERKSATTASGTRATESVWSGMQLLAERDSDGTTYEYIYGTDVPLELVVTPGPGLTGAGIAKRYAYQTDAGGSVIGITDASGAEIARYAYDPFGNPTATSGTDPLASRNPLRYRGYYYGTETGLYYLPARYYEPRSARFLSVDPAAPAAGDPATINRYAYCAGDPVGASDPTGAVMTEYYSGQERSAVGEVNIARSRVHHKGLGGIGSRSRKQKDAFMQATAARLGRAVRNALDVYRKEIPDEYDFGHVLGFLHVTGDFGELLGAEGNIYGELIEYDDLARYSRAEEKRCGFKDYDLNWHWGAGAGFMTSPGSAVTASMLGRRDVPTGWGNSTAGGRAILAFASGGEGLEVGFGSPGIVKTWGYTSESFHSTHLFW